MKRVAILGSTGSIGRQTLDIVRAFPDEFQVVGLAAGGNVALLGEQIGEFRPRMACCASGRGKLAHLREKAAFTPMEEMVQADDVDLVMVATTGRAGLLPTLEALRVGKEVALANKEVIIMAGEMVMEQAGRYDGVLLPVDSEPSAIWQCLRGEDRDIRRIIVTASGGAFRHQPVEELRQVTPEEALRHPTWKMGKRVTVDSATLMNKAFEVIEVHHLFQTPWEKIEVVIHPQSIIHSMVEFADGSVKAQLSPPDMRLPIQYALFHPKRIANEALGRLDTTSPTALSFEPLDPERYPCFSLALEIGKRGGTYPAVLCAADETAVELFLAGKVPFTDIPRIVERVVARHRPPAETTLETILEADAWAQELALAQAGV